MMADKVTQAVLVVRMVLDGTLGWPFHPRKDEILLWGAKERWVGKKFLRTLKSLALAIEMLESGKGQETENRKSPA